MPGPAPFDQLAGELDYAMFVVTARDGDERDGCLVGFATQTSIEPSRFLACLSRRNRTTRIAARAERLAVHLLPAGAHDLAALFGGETGDDVDKLARTAWHEGPHGLPILDGCPSWFVGRVLDRHDLGDHLGYLLAPETVRYGGPQRSLTFQATRDIEAGH